MFEHAKTRKKEREIYVVYIVYRKEVIFIVVRLLMFFRKKIEDYIIKVSNLFCGFLFIF